MRKFLFCLFVLLCHSSARSQFKLLAEGEEFDAPHKGQAKIIQCKNGYSVYCVIEDEDGIYLKIYDAKHKLQADTHFDPAYGKLKMGAVDGMFEIGGELVLLISEQDSKKPLLYRLIINISNGTLKKEETIASLPRISYINKYAIHYGAGTPKFYVRKDPASDNYAVALFNSLQPDRNERIEIVFYGSNHKEIGRAFYNSPEEKYKYMEFVDMAVIGNQKVSIVAYGYNTNNSGGKESEIVIANLNAGTTNVEINGLDFSKNLVVNSGIVRYNPVSKRVLLFASVRPYTYKAASLFILCQIDPFNNLAKTDTISDFKNLSDKNRELFGEKYPFYASGQNLVVHSDGSYALSFEMLARLTSTSSTTADGNTILTNIGIRSYSIEGKLLNDYLIPKSQNLLRTKLYAFYVSDREVSGQTILGANQFKSFHYLSGKDKTYVFLNDVEENTEKLEKKKKLTSVEAPGHCNAYYYTLEANVMVPAREFVFGKPEASRDHNYAMFTISDYDPANNIYVTLKLERKGHSEVVKMVWLQPT